MPAVSHRRTSSPTALLRIIGRLDVYRGYDRYHPNARTTPTIKRRSYTVQRRSCTIKRRPHTIGCPPLIARAVPHASITLAALFHTRTDTLIYVRVDAADVPLPAIELAVAVVEGASVIASEGAPVIASDGARPTCAAIPPHAERPANLSASATDRTANAVSSHAGGPRTLRAPVDPQVAAVAVGRSESPRQRPRFASDWLLEVPKGEFPALREAISLVVIRRWTLLPDHGIRYASDAGSRSRSELGRLPRV
ncbi:uncharacterized protein SCHCODRAFT_02496672 [Schizophyllum commune H4-8]|uniref:uncharacterized protein n=1 Tax=Schizophyllum commune (strain H4-8 / FGSC 9210) TaxID=578458 RepID=UPI00215DE6B9|nr:uncharacterized protein SCHCODRAFT_02496672 [Schizophyllum commune H4-8]KAI5895006.1 hypothetical protein SCHCODRAFT_02496672 [Schizophyllum commune H4-8]